jgi:uncharacterized peroxidase-related enzyme
MSANSVASPTQPLHLPGVEANPQPGLYNDLIQAARSRNAEYSKIWDLFAFQEDFTRHLARFTEGVLRKPASISSGLRELIAAFTSYQNECRFCTAAHQAAASVLLESDELVSCALSNLEASPLESKDKALLRFVAKITKQLPDVTRQDVEAVRAAGWDDEAIYYAITTCALFNFYNRWITATGVVEMSPEAHRLQGKMLAERGYIREEKK